MDTENIKHSWAPACSLTAYSLLRYAPVTVASSESFLPLPLLTMEILEIAVVQFRFFYVFWNGKKAIIAYSKGGQENFSKMALSCCVCTSETCPASLWREAVKALGPFRTQLNWTAQGILWKTPPQWLAKISLKSTITQRAEICKAVHCKTLSQGIWASVTALCSQGKKWNGIKDFIWQMQSSLLLDFVSAFPQLGQFLPGFLQGQRRLNRKQLAVITLVPPPDHLQDIGKTCMVCRMLTKQHFPDALPELL